MREEMNTQNDPEETQLAPTEPFITLPTVTAFENMTTEPLLNTCCQCKDHQIGMLESALFQQQQPQPAQEAKQANESPQVPLAAGVAGSGLLFTMNTATVSISKEVMIVFLLLLALLLAFWIYCRYAPKNAPALA
jgi:hypothetical protein